MRNYTNGLAEVGVWHIHCGLIPFALAQVAYLLRKSGSMVIIGRNDCILLHYFANTLFDVNTVLVYFNPLELT